MTMTDYGPVITSDPIYIIPYLFAELGVNISVLIMFVRPLRKTIQSMQSMHAESASSKNAKLLFFRSKLFVLAASAAISTLVIFMGYNFTTHNSMFAVDAVLNCFCLVLMSPYYTGNDEYWYRKLCIFSIYCFCQRKYSLGYQEKKNNV